MDEREIEKPKHHAVVQTAYLSTTGRPRKASVGRPRRTGNTLKIVKKIPSKLTNSPTSSPTSERRVISVLTSHFSHIAEIGKDVYPSVFV